jgi:RimJ/RimL family protein N-acetyltransferase
MHVTFEQFVPEEADALIDLIVSDTWQYYVYTNPSRDTVRQWLDEGRFGSEENQTWWIIGAGGERVGMIRMHDLLDETPLLDFRIRTPYRGQGIGTQALRWATEHIFTTWPEVMRIEGQTRQDNIAMRKTFRRCDYVKEAHYRHGWPTLHGERFDSISYAILREDWQSGTVTSVAWDDEPV